MSARDDYVGDMRLEGLDHQVDDETIDALIRGELSGDTRLWSLQAFVRHVQECSDGPVPPRSGALSALLDGTEVVDLRVPCTGRESAELARTAAPVAGPLAAVEQARQSRMHRRVTSHTALTRRLAGPGRSVKARARIVVAFTALTMAALAGLTPGPVQAMVRGVVSTVSPFDLVPRGQPGPEADPAPPSAPGAPVDGVPGGAGPVTTEGGRRSPEHATEPGTFGEDPAEGDDEPARSSGQPESEAPSVEGPSPESGSSGASVTAPADVPATVGGLSGEDGLSERVGDWVEGIGAGSEDDEGKGAVEVLGEVLSGLGSRDDVSERDGPLEGSG